MEQTEVSQVQEQETETTKKKYVRKYTDEARQKQKEHLNAIRSAAMEKKREMKEITLKAKLMKLEPKIELAKKYDEYIHNKIESGVVPQQEIIARAESTVGRAVQPEVIIKPEIKKKKKIIYKEISDDEEEEVVYIKKNKPRETETLDRTLYKSAAEKLHMRALEERIKQNLIKWGNALEPVEL